MSGPDHTEVHIPDGSRLALHLTNPPPTASSEPKCGLDAYMHLDKELRVKLKQEDPSLNFSMFRNRTLSLQEGPLTNMRYS